VDPIDSAVQANEPRSSRLTIVALLHLHTGKSREFDEFEAQAARIMARHGGRIERRIRLRHSDAAAPDELHVVTFPDEASFESYRDDPETRAAAALRATLVRETVVWLGWE
jgi:uncharacterized protein (DUF1330 family)